MSFVRLAVAATLLAAAALVGVACAPAAAQQTDADAIVRGLTPPPPQPLTRGIGAPNRGLAVVGPDTPECAETRSRGIRVAGPGDEDRIIAQKKCFVSVNITVNFDYDSATLTEDGKRQVEQLGKALTDPRIAGGRFMLAGHTDAKGSDDYNLVLSRRRALAVREYLISRFNVSAAQLDAVGLGRRDLKQGVDPLDAANRRVEIVNLAAK